MDGANILNFPETEHLEAWLELDKSLQGWGQIDYLYKFGSDPALSLANFIGFDDTLPFDKWQQTYADYQLWPATENLSVLSAQTQNTSYNQSGVEIGQQHMLNAPDCHGFEGSDSLAWRTNTDIDIASWQNYSALPAVAPESDSDFSSPKHIIDRNVKDVSKVNLASLTNSTVDLGPTPDIPLEEGEATVGMGSATITGANLTASLSPVSHAETIILSRVSDTLPVISTKYSVSISEGTRNYLAFWVPLKLDPERVGYMMHNGENPLPLVDLLPMELDPNNSKLCSSSVAMVKTASDKFLNPCDTGNVHKSDVLDCKFPECQSYSP
jgi:hypothetical protein